MQRNLTSIFLTISTYLIIIILIIIVVVVVVISGSCGQTNKQMGANNKQTLKTQDKQ